MFNITKLKEAWKKQKTSFRQAFTILTDKRVLLKVVGYEDFSQKQKFKVDTKRRRSKNRYHRDLTRYQRFY